MSSDHHKNIKGKRPHVLAIAYPAQGHVGPLMKLSQQIADHGIKVTFVNAESIHNLVLAALSENKRKEQHQIIEIVSIPDGLDPGDDLKDKRKISELMLRVIPSKLEDLIRKINNKSEDEKVNCVMADATVAWALEVAQKMRIKGAMFWPTAVGGFALGLHIPKLIEAGIIDHSGKSK